MPSATFVALDYVCPSLGVVMATMTFAAPVSSLRDRLARGSLGNLNPTPWAMMTGNCLGWVGYSFLTKDLFVLFANVPGLMVSVWLNIGACKLQYREYYDARLRYRLGNADNGRAILSSPGTGSRTSARNDAANDQDPNGRDEFSGDDEYDIEVEVVPSTVGHERKVLWVILLWAIVFSIVAHVSFTHYVREQIIGYIVNVNLCFFYGAPLSTIVEVCRTRSSDSLHVRTVAMTVLNCFFWLAYGMAVSDPFIYVPNGVGFAFGCIQTLLLVVFPSKPSLSANGGGGDVREVLIQGGDEDDSTGADGNESGIL